MTLAARDDFLKHVFERHAGWIWKLSDPAGRHSNSRSIERAFDLSVGRGIDQEEYPMSVATEFAPIFDIPERARTHRPLATVTELYRPEERSVAAPLRLTRRGVLVLASLVGALAAALIGIAWASAPPAANSATGAGSAPAIVSVQQGDSLWSIAARVAPKTDPRLEVERLQQLNHLSGAQLQPGQLLHTR